MFLPPARPYICRNCIESLRIRPTSDRIRTARTAQRAQPYSNVASNSRPFRLAVIGSGPAGFYSAYRLMSRIPEATVDMYEHLPVPFGLVRFGVAPDHPEVKNCQDKFEEVASSPRFKFIGNIDVGKTLPLSSLKPHYDAILFAYGASQDRKLGLENEETISGVHSARAFVGWYNGLPEYAGLNPILDRSEDAMVIGQGNVALDIARILLSPLDTLRTTDIAEHAVEALSRSKVKRVSVIGRRGPLQAAFTIKEARELMKLPAVYFNGSETQTHLKVETKSLPRQQRRLAELLAKGTPHIHSNAPKSWELRYLLSPSKLVASGSQLEAVEFSQTRFATSDSISPTARVSPAEDAPAVTIPGSLAFRSIGYKSAALPGFEELGVPFDRKLGIIPNDVYGRVLNPYLGPGSLTAGHVAGLYCAGWVKRGPTGVIASTMEDAFASADVIVSDWDKRVPFLNAHKDEGTKLGWDGVRTETLKRGLRPVNWDDWRVIDREERRIGAEKGKEREKFKNVDDMLAVLDR